MIQWLKEQLWNRVRGQFVVLACLLAAAYQFNHVSAHFPLPGSPQAQNLTPDPVIVKTASGYRLSYFARNVSANGVFDRCDIPRIGSHISFQSTVERQRQCVFIEVDNEMVLRSLLQQLQAIDQLEPGAKIIHGRLVDESGNPMAKVLVNVMGSYYSINSCLTRADGTFTIILRDPRPPDHLSMYLSFQILSSSPDQTFTSRSFSLSDENPVAYIDASRTLIERTGLFFWLAGLVTAVFGVRDIQRLVLYIRRIRRKPGGCPTCGYDLRGTPGNRCSECGMEIPENVVVELVCAPDQIEPACGPY